MTTLKNYYITVKAHQLHTLLYKANAANEEEAKRMWENGEASLIDTGYDDTISETLENIEEE